MKQAIDVRDMHTAIHNLFEITSKPKTVIKAFQKFEDAEDDFMIEECWRIINDNTNLIGEFNYCHITMANTVIIKDQKYRIINPMHFDIYGL